MDIGGKARHWPGRRTVPQYVDVEQFGADEKETDQ
jgi:hypothetical protein